MSYDRLNSIPVSTYNNSPTPQELKVMNAMFGGAGDPSPSTSSFRLLISGGMFFALGLPFVDSFIKGLITASDVVILAIKTGLFLLILIVLQLFGW